MFGSSITAPCGKPTHSNVVRSQMPSTPTLAIVSEIIPFYQHPAVESSMSCAASDNSSCWLCRRVLEQPCVPFNGFRAGLGGAG
jgi:hypothetical protein